MTLHTLQCVWQQFNRFELHDGRICERDFAESLVVYAGYNAKRRVRMLKRVKKAFKGENIVSFTTLECDSDDISLLSPSLSSSVDHWLTLQRKAVISFWKIAQIITL